MFKINDNYLKLPGSYLFSTIAKKVAAYKEANPEKKDQIISLGIGDVTLPLAPAVIARLHSAVDEMAVKETFKGYAPDLGYEFLRSAIAQHDYKARGVDMKSLSVMVPRAIPAISGIFFQLITVLRYVTRFTLFMLIRTLWQAEQGITILQQRDFPM